MKTIFYFYLYPLYNYKFTIVKKLINIIIIIIIHVCIIYISCTI